jgi:uncharacterized protein
MIRIKTVIQKSPIHSIGLFANQFVPKGTITWQQDPEFDIYLPDNFLEKIPEVIRDEFYGWVYFDYSAEKYILCCDNQRFINHSSDNYNIISEPSKDVALRDIQIGEELLCNYNHYEENWFIRRGLNEADFK